jgi:hypothetical protein
MIALLPLALMAAQADVAPLPTPDAPPKSDYICKTVRHTGSHLKKSFVCLTKKDWGRIIDANEAFSRRMVDEARGGSNSY